MLNNIETTQLTIPCNKRSYLDKVKDDLTISNNNLQKCRKHSEKWNFYKQHILWLESEIDSLS